MASFASTPGPIDLVPSCDNLQFVVLFWPCRKPNYLDKLLEQILDMANIENVRKLSVQDYNKY